MPISPRQNTSSAALNQAEAILMQTAIVAKNSDAASIHSACIRRAPWTRSAAGGGGASTQRRLGAHEVPVPLVEVLHAVFHGALVGTDLVVAALEQCLAAGVHAQRDLVVLDA